MSTTTSPQCTRRAEVRSVEEHLGAATPLQVAVERGNADICRFLLSAGAEVDTDAEVGFSPLHLACSLGHASVVHVLAEYGATLSKSAEQGVTPLLIAAQHGHTDVVATLLEAGAGVNVAAENGIAPIHLAAAEGRLEILTLLCEAPDVNVDLLTENGFSALDFAARGGSVECCMALCSYGAKMRDDAYEQAAEAGQERAMAVLEVTRFYDTPLHFPTAVPPARARALLRAGADVHAEAAMTPLGVLQSTAAKVATPYTIACGMAERGEAPPGSTADLILAAAEPWSAETHGLFPEAARAHAVEVVRLGYQLSSSLRAAHGQERAFLDAWMAHVLPHAISR